MAGDGACKCSAQALFIPGRCDDVDAAEIGDIIAKSFNKSVPWKSFRVLFAVESFFLDDKQWLAILDQGEAGVVSCCN